MITNLHTIENGSAPLAQGRTSNPRRKRAWRPYAILAVTLAAASVQGASIVNNLNQPVSHWGGPIRLQWFLGAKTILVAMKFTFSAVGTI